MSFLMWKFILVFFLMAIIVGCIQHEVDNPILDLGADSKQAKNYFPLSDGAYWIYQGL